MDDEFHRYETINTRGQEWMVEIYRGSLVGDNESITLYPKGTSPEDSYSRYKFNTDEIYYSIDSIGRIHIYSPESSYIEPIKKDSFIVVHVLRDYDACMKYRWHYSEMGLSRIRWEKDLKSDD